jgi:hypothetical protein
MSGKVLRPAATLIDPQGFDVTPLPWEDVETRIDAAQWYWLTTVHPSGRPHTRPVLAVWTDGVLCTTSSRAAQKGRNLHRDPRCSVAIMDDDMHIVLEGTASPVESGPDLERVAEAYRAKYNWPATVVEGGFEAPYAAPAAGPAPYEPYRITPTVVYGLGTAEPIAHRHTPAGGSPSQGPDLRRGC